MQIARTALIAASTIAVAALAGPTLGGCDGSESARGDADAGLVPWSGVTVLVAPEDWQPVEVDADPFDDRPAVVECPAHGAEAEDGIFEIETDICRYGTFEYGIPVDLRPGDAIIATVWHLQLWAPEVSEGHVALMLDDVLLWEQYVPIPRAEAVYPVSVILDAAVPAGTPMLFHVHNHGANSWRLLEVEAHRE